MAYDCAGATGKGMRVICVTTYSRTQRATLDAIGTPRRYALVDSDNGDSPVKSRRFSVGRMRAKLRTLFQERNRIVNREYFEEFRAEYSVRTSRGWRSL